jgi:methionyl-tRNA formyltransferase
MVKPSTERARIVILTRDGPEHRYVVNTLCAVFAIERVIVDRRLPTANVRRAMRQGFRHFLSKAARTTFLKVIGDDEARVRALRRLFGRKGEAFDTPDKIDSVDGINSSKALALLKQVDPDVILIYGTSMVKDAVLGLSRDMCFNMHTGISPYYRGTACAFWPIVNGEFEMLGATIHECTSRIDGGSMFELVRATYEAGDDLHTLFGRTVIAGAEAYIRVVERYLSGTLEGTPQDLTLGREYRGSDLTIGPELVARLRLARMRRKAHDGAARRRP